MAWDALTTKRQTAAHPITMSVSAGIKTLPPLLTITLRFAHLPPMPFLTETGTCDVLIGRDEHAGLLRLVPGESTVFFTPGKKTSLSGSLRLKAPAWIKPGARDPQPVEFTTGEGMIEIRLPDWAAPPAKAPARYVGVSERVPDPAAPLRGPRA